MAMVEVSLCPSKAILLLIFSSASSLGSVAMERVSKLFTTMRIPNIDNSNPLRSEERMYCLLDEESRSTMLLIEFVTNCPCRLDDSNAARGI